MRRSVGYILALLLVGCGLDETSQTTGAAGPPGGPSAQAPTLPVRSSALSTGLTNAKVVLRTTSTVELPVQLAVDSEGVTLYETVPCTPAGSECAPFTGATCATTGSYAGYCVTNQTVTKIFYVRNSANPPASGFTFPVPCDGHTYAAEVYTAIQSSDTGPLALRDMLHAPAIVADSSCALTTQPVWAGGDANQVAPTLNIPTIYANLPAPYNTYTVGVQGLTYPWSTAFTLAINGGTVNTYAGSATLASPSTAASLSFVPTFKLDSSILLGSEATTPWQLTPQAVTVTPVNSAQVPTL